MTIAELTQTKGWKNFMSKLYGIGAAVVIIGALFKIMHWPGAGPMLVVGLGTEAVIFFFSAFEPLHEEDDWSLVFPQLAGLDEGGATPAFGSNNSGPNVSLFDEKLMTKLGNSPQLFEKLTDGLQSLSNTASNLSDISNAALATNEYTQSMNKAASTVNEVSVSYKGAVDKVNVSAGNLAESYNKSAETISYSVDNVSDAFSQVSNNVKEAGNDMVSSYKKLTDSMTIDVDFSSVVRGNENYNEKITVLNKNLTALNAVFELQLEGGLDSMMDDLKGAVVQSEKYKTQVSELAKKVESLNTVYGNMLAAMTGKA